MVGNKHFAPRLGCQLLTLFHLYLRKGLRHFDTNDFLFGASNHIGIDFPVLKWKVWSLKQVQKSGQSWPGPQCRREACGAQEGRMAPDMQLPTLLLPW